MNHPKVSRYRLLACDLDGTLMGADITISPRVQQALAAVQSRGIYVTLATGRGFPATLPFARSLNITIPLICYQGGLIKHPMTGDLLLQATMDRSLVLQVIDLARTRNWHLVIYIDDAIFIQRFRCSRSFYEEMLGSDIQCVEDLKETVRENALAPAKFLIVADEAQSDSIQLEMSTRFNQQMDIVRSHAMFVEGNPRGVNKGDALRRLAEHLSVPQAQVMAIGDQGNDVPMLAWAGLGIAMGTGSAAAQAVADWVAPSLADEGAAVAIERFLLR